MDTRSLHEAATITDPIERARVLTRLMTEDLGLTDAAARYRRHAIAQARDQGHTREQIAAALGVTPPRIAQISKGTGCESTRRTSHADALGAGVQRALPTLPSVRKSHNLYLVEAERQGIKADRKMLHIGLEPGQRACRRHPSGPPRRGRGGRPQVDVRQRVPVRIAPSFFRADLFGDTRVVESAFVGVSPSRHRGPGRPDRDHRRAGPARRCRAHPRQHRLLRRRDPGGAAGYLLAVLLLITAMFAIGLLVTAVARTAAVASGLSWALFMPLAFFGGILMSLEFMPAALRTISD